MKVILFIGEEEIEVIASPDNIDRAMDDALAAIGYDAGDVTDMRVVEK